MGKALKSASQVPKTKKKISILQIVGMLFMVYFVYTIFNQQVQINKYNSQIDMYEENIQNTNALISYYSEQKANIESDDYIESVAREKLGYVKPNEKIFVDANR